VKKTIEVIITKEIEVEINDDRLTPESIVEFEKSFWKLEDGVNSLFRHTASQFAYNSDPRQFIEGVGQCIPYWEEKPFDIRCREISDETETEITQA
jgi:hypothetical protein